MYIDVLQVMVAEDETIISSLAFYCDCGKMTQLDTFTEHTVIKCNCTRPFILTKIEEEFFGQPYTIQIERALQGQNKAFQQR